MKEEDIHLLGVGREDIHYYQCDGCGQAPIKGIRYHCLQCEDYDLCQDCYDKGTHQREKDHNNFQQIAKSTT